LVKLGDLDFTKYKSHQEAAQAIADSLNTFEKNYYSAIKTSFSNFLKRELQKGLKIRKDLLESGAKEVPEADQNVLTKCIFFFDDISELNADLPNPASSDYMIYFSLFMVEALMKANKCVLNKSNAFMELYKEVVKLTFNLDENANLSGFEDYEEYHYDWLFKHIDDKSILMDHFKTWVNMNKDEEGYRP